MKIKGSNKVELGKKRGARVKQLLKEKKMRQSDLADLINCTPEHLCAMLNGKRTITNETAQQIADVFKPVRREWILCEDDYRTEQEKNYSQFCDWNNEWKRRLAGVQILASLSGYEIEIFQTNTSKCEIETVLQSLKEGYKIIKNGEVLATCSLERFNLLALDCQELVEQRIKSYVREASNDG